MENFEKFIKSHKQYYGKRRKKKSKYIHAVKLSKKISRRIAIVKIITNEANKIL
jgi:hypothetical protein